MNAADKCVSLLKEINISKTEFLPPFYQSIVDECLSEMNKLSQDNLDDERNPVIAEEGYTVKKTRIALQEYIKRCLLAYHNERLVRLKKFRWEFGRELPEEITCNLSEREKQWYKEYCDNIEKYMGYLNDGRGWDLSLHQTAPKRIYCQVRCTTDYGEYILQDGTAIFLEKDSIHYLPFTQCEKLIHSGVLVQLMD